MNPTTADKHAPDLPQAAAPPRGFGAVVAVAIVVIATGAIWFAAARGHTPLVGWYDGLDAAAAASPAAAKPQLVLYTADWCGACQQFKKAVLTDPAVAEQLGRDFVRVKMDVTDANSPNSDAARRHGVDAIPTLIVYAKDGAEVDRLVGGLSRDEFLNWLQQARAKMR
jgi:thioredoxin:protein disulfide reductase